MAELSLDQLIADTSKALDRPASDTPGKPVVQTTSTDLVLEELGEATASVKNSGIRNSRLNSERALDVLENESLRNTHAIEDNNMAGVVDQSGLASDVQQANIGVDVKAANQPLYDEERKRAGIAGDNLVTNMIESGASTGDTISIAAASKDFKEALFKERSFDTIYSELQLSKESGITRSTLKDLDTHMISWSQGINQSDEEFSTLQRGVKGLLVNAPNIASDIIQFFPESPKAIWNGLKGSINSLQVLYGDALFAILPEPERGLSSLITGEVDDPKAIFKKEREFTKEFGKFELKTTTGHLVAGFTELVGPYLGTLKVLSKWNKLKNAPLLTREMLAGAVADFAILDPYEKRLADFVKENDAAPEFTGWFIDFLSSDPNDSMLEGRLKGALEGMLVAGAVEGVLKTAKLMRAHVTARRELETKVTSLLLSEAVGNEKAVGLSLMDSKSLKKLFMDANYHDPVAVSKISKITTGRTDSISKRINNALDAAKAPIDPDDIIINATSNIESAGARTAKAALENSDEIALDGVKGSIELLNSPNPQMVDTVKQTIDADNEIALSLIPDYEGSILKSPIDDMAINFNNGNKVANAIADDMLFEKVTKAQTLAEDAINSVVFKSEVDYGPTSISSWKVENPASRYILPPEKYLGAVGGKEGVTNPTIAYYQSARLRKGLSDLQKNIYKGLKKGERSNLNHVLKATNDIEQKFFPVEGGIVSQDGKYFLPANNKEVDAYYGIRNTTDAVHSMMNSTSVNIANAQGYQKLDTALGTGYLRPKKGIKFGTEAIDKDGNVIYWNKEASGNGGKLYEFMDDKLEDTPVLLSKSEQDTLLKTLEKSDDIIGYKESFTPVNYEDDFFIVKLSEKDGAVISAKTTHTAPTSSRAAKLVKSLNADDPTGSYVSVRAGKDVNEFAYGSDFAKGLRGMNQEQLAPIAQALKKSGWKDEQIEQFLTTTNRQSFKKNTHLRRRGERLLGDQPRTEYNPLTGKNEVTDKAPILPSDQSLANYFNNVSEFIELGEVKFSLQDDFQKTYGKYLQDSYDWKSPIDFDRGGYWEMSEAKAIQDQIKRVSKIPTVGELRNRSLLNSTSDAMVDAGHYKTANIVDRIPTVYDMARFAKGTTAISKLYLFALGQLPLQFSQAIAAVGVQAGRVMFHGKKTATVKAMTKANADFMQVVSPLTTTVNFTKNGSKVWGELQKSGFIADIDYAPMRDFIHEKNTFRDFSGGLKSLAQSGIEKSGVFFKMGESLQRTYSWVVERRFLENEIKAGTHPTLTAKDLKEATPEFLNAVSERAMVLTHNLTRMNEPWLARGLQSVPLQFKQIGIKQLRMMMNTKKLTYGELSGMWLTYAAILGPAAAVPFFEDFVFLGEKGLQELTGNPAYQGSFSQGLYPHVSDSVSSNLQKLGLDVEAKTFENWLKGGVASATSDGRLKINQRISMSDGFFSYARNVPLDETLGGPSAKVFKDFALNFTGTVPEFIDLVRGEYDVPVAEVASKALDTLVKPLSGPSKFRQVQKALGSDELRTTTGQLIKENPTFTDLMLTAFSFPPTEAEAIREKNFITSEAKRAYKDWMNDRSTEIAKLHGQGHVESADAEFDRAFDEIISYNISLAATFCQLVNWKRNNKDMPPEMQEMIDFGTSLFLEEGWQQLFKEGDE
jgi:hypothetical protein